MDDPIECTCTTPDPDVIGQCRRCKRVHLSPERVAHLAERAHRLREVA